MFFQTNPYIVKNYCVDISKILTKLSYVERGDEEDYSTYNHNHISRMLYGSLDDEDTDEALYEEIEPMLYGTHVEYEYTFHSESYDIWKTLTEIPTEESDLYDEDVEVYNIYHEILKMGISDDV